MNRILSIAASLASLTILASSAVALSPEVTEFVYWETRANEVSQRSSDPIELEHFEIPLSAVTANLVDGLDPSIRDSLIFTKENKQFVRWIINPEDTRWVNELQSWLSSKGHDVTRYKHFTAYRTASRSMIVKDPSTKAQFSVKVSTNQTGGQWRDKKQEYTDAMDSRTVSDLVEEVSGLRQFEHAVFQFEPAAFGVRDIDQGMIIRSLAQLPEGGRYYLPGFSAVHDKVGREIAALNGSESPASFWNEHYNKPLARALAEFAAMTGLTFDSPHSQNFLIELDSDKKPTGRIVIRDFVDSYVIKDFYEAIGRSELAASWGSNAYSGTLKVSIGLLHGNTPPSWLTLTDYNQWGSDFYQEFEDKFSSLTGVSKDALASNLTSISSWSYHAKNYRFQANELEVFKEHAQKVFGSSLDPCAVLVKKASASL